MAFKVKLENRRLVCCFIGLSLIMGMGGGCGSDAKSDATTYKACELLIRSEIESILGGAVDEPREMFKDNPKRGFWMSTCNYYSPDTSRSASILIQSSPDADPVQAFESHTASLKRTLGDDYTMQTIDGIGTRAGWDGSVKTLTVFEGPRMLIVSISRPNEDQEIALQTAKRIAATVIPKLAK